MRTLQSLSELMSMTGQEITVSDWTCISQEQVNRFAEATGDHQWIHVDVERAKTGPFGGPIAHGFLTLSLIPYFFDTSVQVQDVRMGVNYGLNRVRFMAPVPVGSRLRARLRLIRADTLDQGGAQLTWEVSIEKEGSDKPVCVAESLARLYT